MPLERRPNLPEKVRQAILDGDKEAQSRMGTAGGKKSGSRRAQLADYHAALPREEMDKMAQEDPSNVSKFKPEDFSHP